MDSVDVRMFYVKVNGPLRHYCWTLMIACFMIFLFQLSVPLVVINQINDNLCNTPAYLGNDGTNDTVPVYVVPFQQVVEDNIAVLTCWGGSFLFLLSFMLMLCSKLKTLTVLSEIEFVEESKEATMADLVKMQAEKFPDVRETILDKKY